MAPNVSLEIPNQKKRLTYVLNALAALDGPSAARLSERRGGDGKDCGGGEYEELGEHGGLVDAEY